MRCRAAFLLHCVLFYDTLKQKRPVEMNLSLLSLITDMTLPNDTMLYLRKKGKIVNAESVDLSVLTLYKDYVVVPI